MTAARPESGAAEGDSAGVEAQTRAQIAGISLQARNSAQGAEIRLSGQRSPPLAWLPGAGWQLQLRESAAAAGGTQFVEMCLFWV